MPPSGETRINARPLACHRASFEERVRGAAVHRCPELRFDPAWDTEVWPHTGLDPEEKRRLRAAVATWHRDRNTVHRDQVLTLVHEKIASVGDRAARELCDAINERGGRDPVNAEMRDVCFHHALFHHLAGDATSARTAHAMLQRFAEVVPGWKIYRPHYGEEKYQHVYDQDWPDYGRIWDVAGIWGQWWYKDPLHGVPLAEAYDLIYDSRLMQDAGTLDTIEHMIRIQARRIKDAPRCYSNMDGTSIRSILLYAELLSEPQWVHDCARWIQALYRTQFYADGWWHEGTPFYHKHIHRNLTWIMRESMTGYSDPPGFVAEDGTRFDNFHLPDRLADPVARADHVLATAVQPNGMVQVIHDTIFEPPGPWIDPPAEAKSCLYGCVGHCMLGIGRGENMVQASLHFGGTHGHAHLDCLSITYFAKGRELLSETRYRNTGAPNSTRQWHTMTAGQSQGRRPTHDDTSEIVRRTKQPEDDVPGVPDGSWRWAGHGNAMNDGWLRLFNTDFGMVQVARADGNRAYAPPLDRYRRTIALVRISEVDTYLVDIFQVAGGQTHDYMLHGCLEAPHAAEASLDLAESRDGTIHQYIGRLRCGRTDDAWSVTFDLDEEPVALKTFFAAQRGTEIIRGEAPAMRRDGFAPFFAVRHTGGKSVFAAVHHPYATQPRVQAVNLLSCTPDTVTLRVTLPDRVDTVTATTDGFTHEAHGHWRYVIGDGNTRRGTIIRTQRLEAGDTINAFVSSTDLPVDGSLDGHALMIDLGGLLVQSCMIDHIERKAGETLIVTRDEPGITITEQLIKMEYFPNWGIRGTATFVIAGSRLETS